MRALQRVSVSLGELAHYGRLWVLCALVIGLLDRRNGGQGARDGLEASAAAWLVSQALIKPWVERTRPADEGRWLGSADEESSSFPSSHAASGAAFTLAVAQTSRRAGAGMVAVTALVGYSRVLTGAHHASDVAAGSGIGFATAYALRHAKRRRKPDSTRFEQDLIRDTQVSLRPTSSRDIRAPDTGAATALAASTTKAELLQRARELEIPGRSRMSKEQLARAIANPI